jgi:hypothetical protein
MNTWQINSTLQILTFINIYYSWFVLHEWISQSIITLKEKPEMWDAMRSHGFHRALSHWRRNQRCEMPWEVMDFTEQYHIEGETRDVRCHEKSWISQSNITLKEKPEMWDAMRSLLLAKHINKSRFISQIRNQR